MIKVTIEVVINGVTMQYEKEEYGYTGGNSVIDTDKAQTLLLDGYHKMKKGIESQR